MITGVKSRNTPADPDSNEIWDGDFIITMEGELRIGRGHAHLSDDAAQLRGAGEIRLNENGKIVGINGNSGHYTPSSSEVQMIEQFLRNSGFWE